MAGGPPMLQFDKLSGSEKAAILMLAVGEEDAAQLFSRLEIDEVNPSYYCMNAAAMFEALKKVNRNELTGEYYITGAFELMLKDNQRVEVIDAVPAEDILSINTPEHLATVDAIYRERAQERSGGRSTDG